MTQPLVDDRPPAQPETLAQAVRWLREAVSSKDVGLPELVSYYVDPTQRRVWATDGRLLATLRLPERAVGDLGNQPVLLPAGPVDRFLAKVPDAAATVTVKDTHAVLRAGRARLRVATTVLAEAYTGLQAYQEQPADNRWAPFGIGLEESLRAVAPFMGEDAARPWSTCIALAGSHLYATNNVVVARAELGRTIRTPALLPKWGWEFLLPRLGGISGWSITPTALWFRWVWGGTVRIRQVEASWPTDTVDQVVAANVGTAHAIPDSYRTAFATVASLVPGSEPVCLSTAGVRGTVDAGAQVTVDEPWPGLPEGMETWWTTENLAGVLEHATHLAVDAWPKPAYFTGDHGLVGVIMGRTAPEAHHAH